MFAIGRICFLFSMKSRLCFENWHTQCTNQITIKDHYLIIIKAPHRVKVMYTRGLNVIKHFTAAAFTFVEIHQEIRWWLTAIELYRLSCIITYNTMIVMNYNCRIYTYNNIFLLLSYDCTFISYDCRMFL